jgi:hypothetical protein
MHIRIEALHAHTRVCAFTYTYTKHIYIHVQGRGGYMFEEHMRDLAYISRARKLIVCLSSRRLWQNGVCVYVCVYVCVNTNACVCVSIHVCVCVCVCV